VTTDAFTFLGMERTGELTWSIPVTPGVATRHKFLFGGCGLAAAIAALEEAASRPVVWATAQYLSFALIGATVEVTVTIAVDGHEVTQARAAGRAGAREVFTVNAALGRRSTPLAGTWTGPPDVLAPELCPERQIPDELAGTVFDRLEQRLAGGRVPARLDGRPGTGRCALWVSMENLEASGAGLAIVGDYVPFGIGQALGLQAGGTSLDNTLRVIRSAPTATGWVLLDIHVHAVADGFGHGLVHLWSEDGTLLATASQSAMVRMHRRPTPPG
jgi:acyl-CoA thioesterase